MDFNKTLSLLQESKTRMVELPCGCKFNVPEDVEDGTSEYDDYLFDHKIVIPKQVSASQQDGICSKCKKTIAKDI